MARQGKRDLEKEQFWRRALARFATSDKSRARFCKDEGLSPHMFKYWDEIILERDAEVPVKTARSVEFRAAEPFVPVLVSGASDTGACERGNPVAEFVFKGGSMFLFNGVDLPTLKTLLQALRETAS